MNQLDAEEFTQSLGQIVGGSWRQIALAKKLGVPKALGLSTEQWVRDRLGGYVRMSVADRRQAVSELAANGDSNREIASVLGVGEATVRRDTAPNDAPESEPAQEIKDLDDAAAPNGAPANPVDAVAALAADAKVRNAIDIAAARSKSEETRAENLARPVNVALLPGIYHGDFRELSNQIADDSIDLVFTDPPYDRESVDLYEGAAAVAARILKPGGSFIAYSGQSQFPLALNAVSAHLRYWWTIAGVHEGGNQMLQKLGIRCGWKPLMWFVKGTRGDVQNVISDVIRGDREKSNHAWQQAQSEAEFYIGELCSEAGTVVDFFLGGGTTAAACKTLGRTFIGFEVDASAVERTIQRLAA